MKENIKIYKNERNQLTVFKNGSSQEVFIKQCFPWSNPFGFLSLRNSDDQEVHLIDSISHLKKDEKAIIEDFLSKEKFIIKIDKIIFIEENVELRSYKVLSGNRGKIIYTKLEDWPEVFADGSVLIADLSGDLFKINNLSELDKKSIKIISPYIS